MANNFKNKNNTEKTATKKVPKKASSLSTNKSSYLDEKDRKAIEFLKRHPVPESFFH